MTLRVGLQDKMPHACLLQFLKFKIGQTSTKLHVTMVQLRKKHQNERNSAL